MKNPTVKALMDLLAGMPSDATVVILDEVSDGDRTTYSEMELSDLVRYHEGSGSVVFTASGVDHAAYR